jgi:hypothetical protein
MANGIQDWLDVTRQILDELSDVEARFIAQETARRVYSIS